MTLPMHSYLQFLLPTYFLVYFLLAFLLKSIAVARKIGKNPLVLPRDDSAYGLVGRYFKITLGGLYTYTLIYALSPTWYPYLLPVHALELPEIQYTGIGLLFVSLIWTMLAQRDMRNSWRIGIDTAMKTELVTGGLFRISRNPVFLGMIISLTGLFLTTPNACTLIFLIVGYVLIQVQIRLEEAHLTQEHDDQYLEYKKRVRRMI